jgi:hypothetical protein
MSERKIPGHDSEDRAKRIERHEGFRPVPLDRLPRQHALRMIGEVIAIQGAFLDLAEALGPGFSHLDRHELGEFLLAAPQTCGDGPHHHRTFTERRFAPALKRFMCPARDGERLLSRVAVIRAYKLSGCGVVGFEEGPANIGFGLGMRLGLMLGVFFCHVALARETVMSDCARLERLQAVVTSASVRSAS